MLGPDNKLPATTHNRQFYFELIQINSYKTKLNYISIPFAPKHYFKTLKKQYKIHNTKI